MRPALAAALLLTAVAPPGPAFVDPLDVPATRSALAGRGPLHAVALAGRRLVAVGERGHVLWSDDGGRTWTQADVPVSTDLTAVRFVSGERGWAAGHDGVVLRTLDAGRSWERQLDGRSVGPDASLLDVWFADERTGFAVGAFGLILATEDGGATWSSWRERTENPRQLHLYAITASRGEVWIAGEQGLLLRLEAGAGRFRSVRAPYAGTFFGVTACGTAVLAFGLRGTLVRTEDRGASWRRVHTGLEVSITAATRAPDGRLVLVSQEGDLLVSEDCGATLRTASPARAASAAALASAGAGALVVVGPAGARIERIP
jgi:photosystem II stability/assembly factor-like uncharacterized protein